VYKALKDFMRLKTGRNFYYVDKHWETIALAVPSHEAGGFVYRHSRRGLQVATSLGLVGLNSTGISMVKNGSLSSSQLFTQSNEDFDTKAHISDDDLRETIVDSPFELGLVTMMMDYDGAIRTGVLKFREVEPVPLHK
jgi:hypothetical protein